MKNKIYLKKVGSRGNINIWIVDGQIVRTTLDEEFTNFGQHFRFPCIPENEFWLDKESVPDERHFFIDHLLVEYKLQKQGKSYAEAIDAADKKELSERRKAGDINKVIAESGRKDPGNVHIRLLNKITYNGEELEIWTVSGRLVRSAYYIDFTEGGHHFIYSFVPKNEVWLDDDISADERPFVLLHELNERMLMRQGLTYTRAHKRSSKLEWESRHDSVKLADNLKKFGVELS